MSALSDVELIKKFSNSEEIKNIARFGEEFNIFKALNIIRKEIRHSNFLAWLLDPTESHKLGNTFLELFIQNVNDDSETKLILSDVEIHREWKKRIDILIVSHTGKFVYVIENKIDSKEYSNQLEEYRKIIEKEYKEYNKTYIYLTIDGEEPSDPEYQPLDYSRIYEIIEEGIASCQYKKDTEVLLFIQHYKEMIERYLMENSELQQLCKEIYIKHQKVIDLINEYKPDQREIIKDLLESFIKEHQDLEYAESSKGYIRFIPKILDEKIPHIGKGWRKSIRQMLLFEFVNEEKIIKLKLVIGPGPHEVREKLRNIALENKELFNAVERKFGVKHHSIYIRDIIDTVIFEDKDIDEIERILRDEFESLLNEDIKELSDFISLRF